MYRSIAICLIALFVVAGANAASQAPVAKIIVDNITKAQYLDMVSLGLDIIEVEGVRFAILAHGDDRAKLQHLGIPYQVEQEDMAEFYATRAAVPNGGFRTFAQIVALLDSLSAANPNIMTAKFSVGQTYEGEDIWVVKVSDNPNVDEDEPEVFYNSYIHAREPAGAAALLTVLKYLVANYGTDQEATDIVNNRELFFMPVVNPDGVIYNELTNLDGGGLWRKNRRPTGANIGIDLNRNFGFKWGYDDIGSSPSTGSDVYRGPSAFSEVETQVLRDFVISRDFSVCNNIHSYSNLFIWPYGYDRVFTHQEDFFANLGDSLAQYNGYAPDVSWTLYPTNGAADDWMWGDTISKPRFVSLTTEIGGSIDGFWPAPTRIPVLEAENLQPNLFLAKIADNPLRLGPPARSLLSVPDSVGQDFTVSWHTDDSINQPVSYKLFELTNKQTVTDIATSDNGYWAKEKMALSAIRAHTPPNSWHSQNQNKAHHWLLSQTPYKVPANDSLVFWIWYNLETDWDYFYAQISIDGGFDFINLPCSRTTNSDPNNLNLGNGITGSSGGWVRVAYDLSPYVNKEIFIRLTQFTDSYTLNEGVYIDDIENVDMFGSETMVAAGIADTSYTFSSHPTGSHWYRVIGKDVDNQESRISTYVMTTVYQQMVIGDLNGDTHIDLSDLSIMISYILGLIPLPEPAAAGNLNCTGQVDLSDLSLMISHILGQVPAPTCP